MYTQIFNTNDESGPLAPGVYFQELALQHKRDAETGVPVFVGFVKPDMAPVPCRRPRLGAGSDRCRVATLTAWKEFSTCVGQAAGRSFLDYAVRGFFENGGDLCVVVALPETSNPARELKRLFAEGSLLEDLDEVDLVCVPDLMRENIRSNPNLVLELQLDVLNYCRRMGDRFAILDSGLTEPPEADAFWHTGLEYDPAQLPVTDAQLLMGGAVYFPWIKVRPLPHRQQETGAWVPPCGHVAGIYARTDAAFGVHKAPANEEVEGALDLQAKIGDQLQIRLNQVGVNCLRSFPGRGIRVWGARTLYLQPDWKYVNVRRLFLTLVRWLERNFHDLVFECYEPELWDRVRERIEAYCFQLFQQGALKGRSRSEAYFVKCDAELNTLEVREAGQVICEIGLAPVVPAEFVIVRITQSAAGITAIMPASAPS